MCLPDSVMIVIASLFAPMYAAAQSGTRLYVWDHKLPCGCGVAAGPCQLVGPGYYRIAGGYMVKARHVASNYISQRTRSMSLQCLQLFLTSKGSCLL